MISRTVTPCRYDKEERMIDGGFGGCVTCECDQEVECVIYC